MTAGKKEIALVKQLLEAGVHFGHQTKKWNPKMEKFIFGEKEGIYIIDLEKTAGLFMDACKFLNEAATAGSHILFVGTKKRRGLRHVLRQSEMVGRHPYEFPHHKKEHK